jgi:hypothetical protein
MGGMGGAADVCKDVPAGKLALIDDFNDGDNITPFDPGREAFWFTIHDMTAGTIEPPNDFMPSKDGFLGTPSAHVVAKGYTEWGAALEVSLNHKTTARCPYNAGNFKGLHFVTRGSGVIRVQFVMPQTQDKEFGGTCDPAAGQVCYDTHGTYITLGSDYEVYDIPWDTFQQKGWGTPVDFDPKNVIALAFSMEKESLPVDLWVDDIKFWDGTPSPPIPGEGGAGGASSGGMAGEAGQSAGGTGGDGGWAGSETGGSE